MFNHKSPTTLQAMADEVSRCAQEAGAALMAVLSDLTRSRR